MAKSRNDKSELLKKYTDLIKSSPGYILVDISGLETASITNFKKSLQDSNAKYTVIKNSVFKIALQDTEQPVQTQDFDGPAAVITYGEDPTAPAKLIKKLQKETEKFDAKLGTLNGEYVDAKKIMELADIPSREELLARLVGTMNAPLTGVMNMLTGNVRGFTMVLKQLSEKSE